MSSSLAWLLPVLLLTSAFQLVESQDNRIQDQDHQTSSRHNRITKTMAACQFYFTTTSL